MKPSLMWALAWPNSNGNTMRGLCPRWDAQAVMATRWNMSIKRHSPPAGRYVQSGLSRINIARFSNDKKPGYAHRGLTSSCLLFPYWEPLICRMGRNQGGVELVRPCTVCLWKDHDPGADFFPRIASGEVDTRRILELSSCGSWSTVIQECINPTATSIFDMTTAPRYAPPAYPREQ